MSAFIEHDWYQRPLPPNVELGERTWIYSSFAFLHCRSERPTAVRLGDDTGVYIGTMFDLGPSGEVEVGRCGTLAGPIITTNRRVSIGDHVLISYDVVIADHERALPGADTHGGRDIVIGDDCWVGARAVLLGGAVLGRGAVVGAAAVVDFEVPPYAIAAGNPARIVGSSPPRRG